MKKIILFILLFNVLIPKNYVYAESSNKSHLEISAPSAILMDYSSGMILYEKNPDEKLPLASVTKIMTMLLAMEEIYAGRMDYNDIITASAHAKSYGGSTIFLEEGEQMSVQDILKGVAVASGNDAAVALGEHISGTESLFVEKMNKKASELGMTNTNFVNCNGLDADGHYSTARDIAIMSRELMKYDDIFEYTTIWMDSLRNGTFQLSNTNKLVKYYDGTTGLKTGSTGKAKFCISATAKRENMHLIAVIMGAETSKERQADASTLLNYGFSTYAVKDVVKSGDVIAYAKAEKSTRNSVNIIADSDYSFVYKKSDDLNIITKNNLKKTKVPAKKGEIAGTMDVFAGDTKIAEVKLVYGTDVPKASINYIFKKLFSNWLSF